MSPMEHMIEIATNTIIANKKERMIVHCSAGIGRTGTFISLINLIGKYNEDMNERLSIFGTVRILREQRMLMVERSV